MVARAQEVGVVGVVTVAVDSRSARAALALAEEFPGWAHATAGCHPTEASSADPAEWERVAVLLKSGRFVAVGETGLDSFHDTLSMDVQLLALERQLQLAVELDLPVILHCREAFPELIAALQPWIGSGLRGVLHCFTGTERHLDPLLELGLHVGVGGIATFKQRMDLREAVRAVPEDRLLVETDAPWLAPQPVRGRRNEPAFVAHVAECLASDRGLETAHLAAFTTANARALFRLPGD